MDMTKMIIDAFMKPLYDGNPEGTLLESIKSYEIRLTEYARNNPGAMDPVGDSGTRDEYNHLYMAVMNGNSSYGLPAEDDKPKPYDYSENQKLPTVHEFLDSYRMVYETSVRPNNRPLTDKAYQELFNVENRTDDLIEAQIIIEKEGLILNTVTADYKALTVDFLEAADPNYEVTSAITKATMGVYATATSLEEIIYMGEVAKATCDDIAVQTKLKVEMMQTLMSLIFAWEHSKRKIREGGEVIEKFAQSMVLTRRQARKYYRFLAEDMGITWDVIAATPFYRIMLLNPKGLDELWRIKKVMHPSNLDAMKYVLFEEILSDKSMEEILLTPQKYTYYETPDSNMYSAIDTEYEDLAEALNKDIKYFHRSRNPEGIKTQNELIDGSKTLALSVAGSVEESNKKPKAISKIDNRVQKEIGKTMVKGAVKETAKEVGKGFLRSLFK